MQNFLGKYKATRVTPELKLILKQSFRQTLKEIVSMVLSN